MNRIDRVTAILIQLQSKQIVRAQEIADRFNISLRTVYRDIRTLEESGVPIIGEAGVGYSIASGYRLPPVMFTVEEATAFITAEKLIEKFTDTLTEESYKSAMYKIKAVLKTSEKEFLEGIEDNIEVLKNAYLPEDNNASNPFQTILKSISQKKLLSIQYFANHTQEFTQRTIEPIGVFHQGRYWHLVAFCTLRKDYRDFRLDRISQIKILEEVFVTKHPSLQEFLNKLSDEKELHSVVMNVPKEIIRHLGDQKYYNGYVSEREINNEIEMTFLTSSLEGFARWFMMFGDRATLIKPQELKDRVKEISQHILKK